MGQATVDLPDPMQSPAAPATAGTDDLLAQLAGDEIERLLAETETERPAAASIADSPAAASPGNTGATPAAAAPLTANNAALDAEIAAIAASTEAAALDAATSSAPDEKQELASQLDALFESLNTVELPANDVAPASQAPVPGAPTSPAAATVAPAGAAVQAQAAHAVDADTSAAERQALAAPIEPAESGDVAADAAALAATLTVPVDVAAEEDSRRSVLARILELLGSPLGACSDSLRQTVGKIAIATLLNAIAVLAYTLLFRHH